MVTAKEESNNSPPQSAPEEPQENQPTNGNQLEAPGEQPSNTDPEATEAIDTQLQQSADTPAPLDSESLATAALKAATEAASVALKEVDAEGVSILDQDSVSVPQNQLPVVSASRQISSTPLSHSNPLDSAVLLNENNPAVAFPEKMEIHDATGTILHQLGVNGDADGVQQPPQQSEAAQPNQSAAPNQQVNPSAAAQEMTQATQTEGAAQTQQVQQPAVAHQSSSGPSSKPAAQQQQGAGATQNNVPRKPARMPGTKQCPSCQNTIAAALAKCPKCPHVFREKKEKVKRSGKRGKKNCPKCCFENPSACSSCKNCKYVFRLKLMDKYKQMRPRQTSDTAAAAAAAAAHAAANMSGQHAGVTAVSTVPMPAGVASYPNTVAQPMHPGHAAVSVIPPLTQHPMSIHPHAHNVHATGVPQMHPLPQHPMPHHQSHPQL